MRAFSLLFVVAICFCTVWGQFFAPTFTSPVFMWSNSQFFDGKNLHISEYTSSNVVAESLLSTKEKNPFAKYFSDAKTNPEVIFVFIEPELRTEHFSLLADAQAIHSNGGAFSHLKSTLENDATSSLVISYAHPEEQGTIGSHIVMQLVQQVSKEASIIIASANPNTLQNVNGQTSRVSRLSLDELKNLANTDWSIFSNGITDIICVCFDSLAVHANNLNQVAPSYAVDDSYMYELLHNLEGNYLAVFTAEKPATENEKLARATMMVRGLSDNISNDGYYPPSVVEAHIVMIPFLFILFVGISCTFGVQSDLKFDAEKRSFKK